MSVCCQSPRAPGIVLKVFDVILALINDNGIIVTELSSKDETEAIEGFIINDKKIIGDTQFCIYSLN